MPLAFCSRLITAKPPLSQTTTISLWPVSTGRIDVGVHHQVRAVADHGDDVALGVGHLGAPAAGDLVAHAGVAELAVEGADRLGPPVLAQLARQAAGGGEREVGRVADAVDRADHLGVARHLGVGRAGDACR